MVYRLLVILCISIPSYMKAQDRSYKMMLDLLYKGTVRTLTVPAASSLIASSPHLVVLDIREPEEFKVSHIRGARPAGYKNFNVNTVSNVPKNAVIIVYCSVGYRSERIGELLQKKGYSNVYNLYGGIFEWINQGLPVVDANEKVTQRVHGYSRIWGRWVTRGEKVYE